MITPSKEQSKRSAAHIFAAFQYQWDYFVLQLLATNDDTITVSFELLDDVDKQTGECITLYQIKHSVQKNAKNETINLSKEIRTCGKQYPFGWSLLTNNRMS